jgi:uncharacterized protein
LRHRHHRLIAAAPLPATGLPAWLRRTRSSITSTTWASQALKGLRNIRNHLDVDPKAKITVVTHALGVDFLLEGQKDVNGSPFAGPVAALVARGVKFEICEITLKNRNLKREQFIQEADFTPSGRGAPGQAAEGRARPTSSPDAHQGAPNGIPRCTSLPA